MNNKDIDNESFDISDKEAPTPSLNISHDSSTVERTMEEIDLEDVISNSHCELKNNEIKSENEKMEESVPVHQILMDNDDISNDGECSSEISLPAFDFDSLSKKTSNELISLIKDSFQEIFLLKEENKRFQNELDRLKADLNPSVYEAQIEALEKELAQAKADAFAWENELKHSREKHAQENFTIRSDLTNKLEQTIKNFELANKNKESMVMKYAMAEKEVLVVKKQKENLEKKVKDLERDKEILQGKIKSLTIEKTRICNTLDNKVQEAGIAHRSIDKLKEELNAKDIKIKWCQTKLKTEADAHKETEGKLDRALGKIHNHEEEIRATREEAEKMVKDIKEGENTRANILDKQLQETKALLILEKQKHEDVSTLYKHLKSEHEVLRSSHILLDTEVNTLRVKVSKFEQDRDESEKLFESLQAELRNLKQENSDLLQKVSNYSVFEGKLESEKMRSECTEQKLMDLQNKFDEQSVELSKCREKEAELLAFTQKLTDKDVILQSQLTASQGKVQLMEVEAEEMQTLIKSLQAEVSKLSKELSQLKEQTRSEESKISKELTDKTREVEELRTRVSDLVNEIQVQQKKHANSLKDSNREIQKLMRKLDSYENGSAPLHPYSITPSLPSEGVVDGGLRNGDAHIGWCNRQEMATLSQESRASSDASLNTGDSPHTNESTPNYTIKDSSSSSPISDLPQQVLIDRIIRLQKSVMKKAEKCEFLEEHVEQLVGELKKKNKIIHHYIMREDAGALSSSKSDDAKAEIIKHGGIMASVYGSTPKDGSMTLDLSLEINRKLQAVLEDTLLKNITLKENLNTLGDEVAKLALQNSSTTSRASQN